MMNNKNHLGYYDPTAYEALNPIIKSDAKLEIRVQKLLKSINSEIKSNGFELINIKIKHKKSGRLFG